jgi:hypothetical protein
LRAVADQQRIVPDNQIVKIDRRPQPGSRDACDAAVGKSERVPIVGWQFQQDRHQDAQLATVRDDQNVVPGVRRVLLVDSPHEATRSATELSNALATRRRHPFAVERTAGPRLAQPVLTEQRRRLVIAGSLQDPVVHLTQVRIEDDIMTAIDDQLGRSGGPLQVAGVDRIELNARQRRPNCTRLLLAALIQDDVEVALKDAIRVRARLAMSNQPDRRRHSCLPQTNGRPMAARSKLLVLAAT